MFLFCVSCLKTVETTIIENTTYHITETFTTGQSPSKSLSETNQILRFLIKLVGCIDIILSSAYVVICIHDRKQRATETKFSSPSQQLSGHSTAYENIEDVSFLSSRWMVCLLNCYVWAKCMLSHYCLFIFIVFEFIFWITNNVLKKKELWTIFNCYISVICISFTAYTNLVRLICLHNPKYYNDNFAGWHMPNSY